MLGSALDLIYPDLYNLSLKKEASVADCWDEVQSDWNLSFRRGFRDSEVDSLLSSMEVLGAVYLGREDDQIFWALDSKLSFSTSSLFHKLTECSPKLKVPLIRQTWSFKYPKKVKVFLWSLAYRSINTHEVLQKKLKK